MSLGLKKALITGITGQDGSYLAAFLIDKGYEVHGLKRRTSLFNTDRIDHLYQDPHIEGRRFILHHGDMTDSSSLTRIIQQTKPNEIYNLAAQSMLQFLLKNQSTQLMQMHWGHFEFWKLYDFRVATSYAILSSIHSELFGKVQTIPQNEATPFYPRSPYAVAKLYAHWITVNYREAYDMYACNGILFNHESPVRGETFVTRKITRALSRIKLGLQDCLYLGNLDAKRDWGHAKDYVEMQWLMLQQEKPEDFVIATGLQYSVRDFINLSAKELGISLKWKGEGINEKAHDARTGVCLIAVDPRYYRPTEVDTLLGDSTKARIKLGWCPKISFEELVKEMVKEDFTLAQKDAFCQKEGFKVFEYQE